MIQPFDFTRLPKVSRQDLNLLESWGRVLPRNRFASEIGRSLSLLVQRELRLPFSFQREKVVPVEMTGILPTLPQQGVYVILGLQPSEEKIILELDPFLAHLAIDKLLGGPGEPLIMMRPLTKIEEGVFSYLLLKMLSEFFEKSGRQAIFHFRLDGFQSSAEGISSALPERQKRGKGLTVSLRMVVGERSGYARLLIPASFLESPSSLEGISPDPYYGHRLFNFGYVPTELWGEVGRTTLYGRNLNGLEPGDVIVLEESEVRIDRSQGGRLAGFLHLRVGEGGHGGWRGEILAESDEGRTLVPLRLRLGEIER